MLTSALAAVSDLEVHTIVVQIKTQTDVGVTGEAGADVTGGEQHEVEVVGLVVGHGVALGLYHVPSRAQRFQLGWCHHLGKERCRI